MVDVAAPANTTYKRPTSKRVFPSFRTSTSNPSSTYMNITTTDTTAIHLDISNMCRFPEDVMRRIIFFVQTPSPTPDQTDVTREHLNQKGLSTMMRVCRVRPSHLLKMVLTCIDDLLHSRANALQGSSSQQFRQLLPRRRRPGQRTSSRMYRSSYHSDSTLSPSQEEGWKAVQLSST